MKPDGLGGRKKGIGLWVRDEKSTHTYLSRFGGSIQVDENEASVVELVKGVVSTQRGGSVR
jgi:hypothetical protein